MVAGKDDDLEALELRALAGLQGGQFAGQLLQPSQGTGWFGELCLTRFGTGAMGLAGGGGGDAEPFNSGVGVWAGGVQKTVLV